MKEIIDFDKIDYERISYEDTKLKIVFLIDELKRCSSYSQFERTVKEINDIQNHIEQMYDYADICNMRDNKNEYYDNEIKYWNEYKPKFDLLFKPFYEICLNSEYKEQLKKVVPINFFNTLEYELKTVSEDIVDLQKYENELKKEYRKVIGKTILFDGEEHNLSYIARYFTNSNRNIRKRAHDIYNDFYLSKQNKLDHIFYEMIQVRNQIAVKLGFNNYTEFSLYKLRRFGYNYTDIKKFRDNILKYVKPICKVISKWQLEELGVERLEYFDTIFYKEMPQLKITSNELLNQMKENFNNLDSNLSKVYSDLLEHGYIDLVHRDNKVNFAITNYLTELGYPVITGNFKDNYLDVSTLTHEFGHSYQKYNAGIEDKKYIISPLLKYPTFDIAEMFSYGMELISMKYVENLFSEEDYQKYCFMEIKNLISMMPYIALVDEFQEKIYSNLELKMDDIRKTWLELADKYGLNVSNSGHKNLDTGGYFYRQSHIFLNPFYYIDYAISYFGAFALWQECTDHLDLFKKMCSVASYYPLLDLINKYHITSPFNEESFKKVSSFLEKELLKRRK